PAPWDPRPEPSAPLGVPSAAACRPAVLGGMCTSCLVPWPDEGRTGRSSGTTHVGRSAPPPPPPTPAEERRHEQPPCAWPASQRARRVVHLLRDPDRPDLRLRRAGDRRHARLRRARPVPVHGGCRR